jgi:capsular exopolysaccharide synthesis family protein
VELAALLALLRRRAVPIVACLLLGLGISIFATVQATKTYRATSSVIINIPAARNAQEALEGVQLSSKLLRSYAEVATSRTAMAAVKDRLSLPDDVASLRTRVQAEPEPDTLILSVSFDDPSRARAVTIADAVVQTLIDTVNEFEKGKADAVQARVIDRASAGKSPVHPRPRLNISLGVLLGLLAGTLLALVMDALDRTMKLPAQAVSSFGAPLLAVVPRGRTSEIGPSAVIDQPRSPAVEAYRTLRTSIRYLDPDHPIHTLLVTSPASGDGKTTTATNLAVALAAGGAHVVLVEADLRKARLAEALGLPEGVGVTSVLTGSADLGESIQRWRDTLDVLLAGPTPPNPSELLSSQAMVNVIDALRMQYDMVVIDAPPVIPVTDAVALAVHVDGVIVVARAGKTHLGSAVETRRRLDAVGANTVGSVLNAVKPSAALGYYQEYGYQPPQSGALQADQDSAV